MPSQGPRSGSTFVNSGTGSDWSNPSNAQYSDNNRANCRAAANNELTKHLDATGYGFTIPDGATIDGIVVGIEKYGSLNTVTDNSVRIIKGGSGTGSNKALGGYWGTSDAYYTYGASDDKWGTTWTSSDINSSGFGVGIKALIATNNYDASIDHIRITVHYTLAVDLTDAATLADLIAMHLNTTKDESIALADSIAKLLQTTKTESITLNDFLTVARLYYQEATEGVTLTDTATINAVFARLLTEGMTLADAVSAYAFRKNKPLQKYQTTMLVDMFLTSGTKRFAQEDIIIVE